LLTAAGSMEQMSRHPVARAVTEIARKAKVELIRPADFEEKSGLGVQGTLDGVEVRVGRKNWLAEMGVDFSSMQDEKYAEPEGLSTLYVVRGGTLLGWIGLEDRTRNEARAAMEQLRALGMRELAMITGDRWSVARRVAKEMGCTEVQAEALPADKLDLVAAMREQGYTVAVVGDGVNDAPALAAADVGIAMGEGSDVAMHTAGITLLRGDLQLVGDAILISRATYSKIRQNLFWAFIYNILGLPLAAFGLLSPVIAGAAMALSSVSVVTNSLLLRRLDLGKAGGDP